MSQNSEVTMDCFDLIYTAEIVTESEEAELAECIDISLRQNDIGCASALVVEISQVQGTLAARLSLAREFHQAALQPSTVCQLIGMNLIFSQIHHIGLDEILVLTY